MFEGARPKRVKVEFTEEFELCYFVWRSYNLGLGLPKAGGYGDQPIWVWQAIAIFQPEYISWKNERDKKIMEEAKNQEPVKVK